MKPRYKFLIPVLIVLITAITLIFLAYNGSSDDSFYYGGIRIPENDKLCFVTLTIHNSTLSPTELVQDVRLEISKLGPQYDFEERRIIAEQIKDNIISIEITGSWRIVDSINRPNLLNVFSNLGIPTVEDKMLMTCA